MIRLFLGLLLSLTFIRSFSQEKHCFTSEVMKEWFNIHPELKTNYEKLQREAEDNDRKNSQNNYSSFKKPGTATYTIPVVFHVLHLNGSENISDAQILDAVNILNRDFRKLNPDTSDIVPPFKNLAADVNFEFRLATIDPNGKCTNGIERFYDKRTDWIPTDMSYYAYTWDRSMYLNIYIVRSIAGGNAAAYTFLPGSVGGNMDAIIALHDYVGSFGTSNPYASRTLTHEVGHWFNLAHIWGSGNNAGQTCGDDGVSDTPITKGFGWCGNNMPSVCNPPIVENIQNYMDYAYCPRMFTIGQANRMTTAINSSAGFRYNLWTATNLSLTGVSNPAGPCAPRPEFISNKTVVCKGTHVAFTDLSFNAPVTSWNWSFQNGSPATSTLQNASCGFHSSGTKTVELKVSNSAGSDSLTKSLVHVLAGPGSGTPTIAQNFETINFPDSNWIAPPPNYGSGWQQISGTGSSGNNCIYVNNYYDTPNEPAIFFSPMYDLNAVISPVLSFNVAYSQNFSKSKDRLRIYSSIDCGASWLNIYSKRDSVLHTFGPGAYAIGTFTAPLPNQWRKDYINLNAISSSSTVVFKFEFSPDSLNPGNNILIDDINIESSVGVSVHSEPVSFVKLYPNPASANCTLDFVLTKNEIVSIFIYDVSGKLAAKLPSESLEKGQHEIQINTSALMAGLYFLELKSGSHVLTKKLLVE